MVFHISGRVRELETGRPVAGVTVEAYDADAFADDLLGSAQTDQDGHYLVETRARLGLVRERPDAYVILKDGRGRLLKSTRANRLRNVDKDVVIDVPISCYHLADAVLLDQGRLSRGGPTPASPELTRWRFTLPMADPVFANIALDLRAKASLLELLADYMRNLRAGPDSQARAFAKLAKLFSLGVAPQEVEGHCYGVTLGLRERKQEHSLSHVDHVMGLLWGGALAEESPWVGKSFEHLGPARAQGLLGSKPEADRPVSLGINHFNRLDSQPANNVSYHALTYWLGLYEAPADQRAAYAHERNGGNFLAWRAPSVYANAPREVLSLNYRFASMHNRPPLSWLVDELVQIGDGLYLGQLLVATKDVQSGFDPRRPADEYAYGHMGYFALWDARWNAEARRVFAFLGIPVAAPAVPQPDGIEVGDGQGFRTLTCETPVPAICDDTVFAEVKADLARHESVLHLLKAYADELQGQHSSHAALLRRMQELFNRGAPVRAMSGFYRGALVSWQGDELLELLATNLLDKVWAHAARWSTWTGTRFDDITAERLAGLTHGFENGMVPTTLGAHTQAQRTLREKRLGHAMALANVRGESATPDEAAKHGYDHKSFFFIARAALSASPDHPGKPVYQLNYRWPKLRSIAPDGYCIDELVEIAEGLFLGQLLYATDWLKPYDPTVPPDEYAYARLGYFLLMTEAWHPIRLRLGFDLENV